jgi:hypothetical protein
MDPRFKVPDPDPDLINPDPQHWQKDYAGNICTRTYRMYKKGNNWKREALIPIRYN